MIMDINDFKQRFSKELFAKALECKNLREMIALMEKEGLHLDPDEGDLDFFTSMMSERTARPDSSRDIEWNADCYERFKMFNDTCGDYKDRVYPSDKVWEGGKIPGRKDVPKEHVCMNCDKARVKQYYCLCTK